jgi:hypothetical protein
MFFSLEFPTLQLTQLLLNLSSLCVTGSGLRYTRKRRGWTTGRGAKPYDSKNEWYSSFLVP